MPEGQPMPGSPESKTIFGDLYKRPHKIAERIRALKEEFTDTKRPAIPERKEDIIEEYKILKAEREDIRMIISKYLDQRYEDINTPFSNTKELMQEAARDMKRAQVLENQKIFEKAQKDWYEAYDFVRLFERKNDYLMDMELENED